MSYQLNDISQGQDATPLWIPQLVMAIGGTLFALALVDRLVQVATGGAWEFSRPFDQDTESGRSGRTRPCSSYVEPAPAREGEERPSAIETALSDRHLPVRPVLPARHRRLGGPRAAGRRLGRDGAVPPPGRPAMP